MENTLQYACHGSDGNRMAIAGGFDEASMVTSGDVQILESPSTAWRRLGDTLRVNASHQAGVVLGEHLLCLGGRDSK